MAGALALVAFILVVLYGLLLLVEKKGGSGMFATIIRYVIYFCMGVVILRYVLYLAKIPSPI